MPARTPADLHRLFVRHFAAADLDALVALYEPDAVLYPEPGKRAFGRTEIREVLGGFLALQGRFDMKPARVAQAGDTATLFADWTLEAKAPDGSAIHLAGQTADVVRRQPGGEWLFIIDCPFGAAGISLPV